ncbi:MAG: signal transduction histidine kinase [Flammeovirgaceae bacterium]
MEIDKTFGSQVFENLLSNAIKFSPTDKNIYINLVEKEGEFRAEIRDEGPGMSKEDMSKLFGKFQKLSARPTAGEKSTGLGLSIVKKYVEVMNGKVWCESELGEGASFVVEFEKVG